MQQTISQVGGAAGGSIGRSVGVACLFGREVQTPNLLGVLGCPRKLGSKVSKWVIPPIPPIYPIYK